LPPQRIKSADVSEKTGNPKGRIPRGPVSLTRAALVQPIHGKEYGISALIRNRIPSKDGAPLPIYKEA
jgi:hypothetical protein